MAFDERLRAHQRPTGAPRFVFAVRVCVEVTVVALTAGACGSSAVNPLSPGPLADAGAGLESAVEAGGDSAADVASSPLGGEGGLWSGRDAGLATGADDASSSSPKGDANGPGSVDSGSPQATSDAGPPRASLEGGSPASFDAGSSPASADGGSQDGGPAAWVYGVTADDITNLSGLVDSLRSLPHKATTRVVFDLGQSPSYYAQAVPAIHAASYVMGEILDSSVVKSVSVAAYKARTSDYLAAFSTTVDIWEVGNEINGNWLDTTPGGAADVAAKMAGSFDLVVAAGGPTALTLYGCSDSDPSHDMFVWTSAHVPARMLSGLDYVFVSYYEGDCAVPRSDWPAAFHQLRQWFPKARLGFGEVGAVDANGQDITDVNVSGPYLQRYYKMQIAEPGYVGGYFWWYFYEDMVPKSRPLFGVFSSAIR
jgi:hypothetical protein